EKNRLLFKQENVLIAAGAIEADEKGVTNEMIAKLFEQIDHVIIDQATGKTIEGDPESIDTAKLAKSPETSEATPNEFRRTMVKRISKQLLAYEVHITGLRAIKGLPADDESPDSIHCIVLPIHGNGLWGPMFGFIALSADGGKILGITYYQHKETPGLGGEVNNPSWKAQWPGKTALDESGAPIISVVKAGSVQHPDHEVDGISGATITSKSVSNMIHLWLGDAGFGPYLQTKRTTN
ncbi:MAG: NADH:ubiquinone reductase (Na(+)-transporting) subunit C, partial [Planctomycetes bacterium]|nr:NADH:ubiquinone reductase (Na(+)-transporting) subunit C [Planctomycetota bacterium]